MEKDFIGAKDEFVTQEPLQVEHRPLSEPSKAFPTFCARADGDVLDRIGMFTEPSEGSQLDIVSRDLAADSDLDPTIAEEVVAMLCDLRDKINEPGARGIEFELNRFGKCLEVLITDSISPEQWPALDSVESAITLRFGDRGGFGTTAIFVSDLGPVLRE